jgi:hypothetical protein
MSRIEDLIERYREHIAPEWPRHLAGPQKTIFVVYPKSEERRLRHRIGEFELATRDARRKWVLCDLTPLFPEWMNSISYRDEYFKDPRALGMKLRTDFLRFVSDRMIAALTGPGIDEDTVVAVLGVASLFGFLRISQVLKEVERAIQGRLAVFFPGKFRNGNYRLLDARDGWNYLAVPIVLEENGGA